MAEMHDGNRVEQVPDGFVLAILARVGEATRLRMDPWHAWQQGIGEVLLPPDGKKTRPFTRAEIEKFSQRECELKKHIALTRLETEEARREKELEKLEEASYGRQNTKSGKDPKR